MYTVAKESMSQYFINLLHRVHARTHTHTHTHIHIHTHIDIDIRGSFQRWLALFYSVYVEEMSMDKIKSHTEI